MPILLFVLLSITPPRLFDLVPAKALATGPAEIERTAIAFAPVDQIATLTAGDRIEIPVGQSIDTYEVVRVASFIPGTFSITAKAIDGSGSHIALTFEGDRVFGISQEFREGRFDIYAVDPEMGTAYRAKTRYEDLGILGCATEGAHATHDHSHSMSPFELPDTRTLQKTATGLQSATSDTVTIDILVLYTTSAREWTQANPALGSINVALAQAFNLSQQALDLSQTAIKLRPVHITETTFTEEGTASSSILSYLSAKAGDTRNWGVPSNLYFLLDEAHTLRDLHGADLVALMANVTDTGGIAWLLSSHSGSQEFGFSLNNIRQTHFTYTLVHEIGHNMGNAHGRTQSSQPAGILGGLNPYSTGFRWTAPTETGYVTVMHYESAGFQRTPYFSSPDLQVDGIPVGRAFPDSVSSDNRRSMRQVARTIAAYRQTKTGNASLSVTDNLVVDIPLNSTADVVLDFVNTGNTDAMWRSGRVYRSVLAKELRAASAPRVVYETGFEQANGFVTGNHTLQGGWRSQNQNGTPATRTFKIRTVNPKSGGQHLRLEWIPANAENAVTFYDSPQFEATALGHYRISFDVMMTSTTPFRFDVYFRDNFASNLAGGIIVTPDRRMYTYRRAGAENSLAFWSPSDWQTTAALIHDQYNRFEFEIDPMTGTIRYNINNYPPIIAESVGGNRISSMTIVTNNLAAPGSTLDIDNLKVEQDYAYLPGFELGVSTGTVRPGTTAQVPVTIHTQGLQKGQSYVGFIDFETNTGVKTSRIQVNVTEPVSIEPTSELPMRTDLTPAYPNPFNPSTSVGWQLEVGGQTRVAVYDILGREVAVLADGVMPAGRHQALFNASTLSSGVYIIRMSTTQGTFSRSVTLLK